MPASDEYPHKYLSGAALFVDATSHVLLVKPHYRPTWNLPGGIVEDDESPLAGCVREVREELGLSVPIGRMLVADYRVNPEAGESIQFVFDGGELGDETADSIVLQAEELTDWRFVTLAESEELLTAHMIRRVAAAAEARTNGATYYLEAELRLG